MPKTDPDLLADAFAEMPTVEPLCPFGMILRDASDLAQQRINTWLAADRRLVPNQLIVDRLRGASVSCGKETVSKHRNGRCRCKADA